MIGLFEGEGSITHNGSDHPVLKIGMTDWDVLEQFRVVMGWYMKNGLHGPYHDGDPKHKPLWMCRTAVKDTVYNALQEWLPYLGERRTERAKEIMNEIAN